MWAIVGALSCLGLEGYQILTNVYKLTNVRIMWTILNLGKKWYLMTPPLGPKLGKIWNVDYFDIVAPPLTLTKTVPKSHQTDTWGLFHSYIGHICTKCSIYLTNISPIYHKNQGHISVIWIWEKCEKFRPPPSSQISLHLKCRLFCLRGGGGGQIF